MPRAPRVAVGGTIYHVLNRANGGIRLFDEPADYEAFERVLAEAHERLPMRTLAYCIMPTHWHLVLWPHRDGDLSAFLHWATLTHTQRWHGAHDSVGSGHLYQGRFKSFPVQSDRHFLTVCRYVERNPVRAGLVPRAEQWPWSSLARWTGRRRADLFPLSPWPLERPADWVELVNAALTEAETAALRECVARGRPYGDPHWVPEMAKRLGLHRTLRRRGRPMKKGS